MGQPRVLPKRPERNVSASWTCFTAWSIWRSVGIAGLGKFHPGLQFCFDPYWRLNLFKVSVLDVLFNFGTNLRQRLLRHVVLARSRGITANKLDDLARLI